MNAEARVTPAPLGLSGSWEAQSPSMTFGAPNLPGSSDIPPGLGDASITLPTGTFPAYGEIGTDMLSQFAGLTPAESAQELEYMRIAESLILKDVITSPYQREQIQSYKADRPTMAHELGHALLGHDQNYSGDFSARPSGQARGLTRIYGDPSDEDFSIMAAGSMYSHFFGDPSGFGHDQMQVNLRNTYSWEEAQSKAVAHLKGYDAIFHNLTDIATFMQHELGLDAIPFSQLPLLIQRAQQELELKELGIEHEVYKYMRLADQQTLDRLKDELHSQLVTPRTYREIIDHGNGIHGVVHVVNGEEVDAYDYCGLCGSRNGDHKLDCNIMIKHHQSQKYE